ncbi:MAG: 50S ribosomal protein L11 methyltransferase [Prevotella sp.]|nr:50S ribosomal protein L11 methyltransferase [Prevotella sp.]
MKYYEVEFTIQGPQELHQEACDVLSAMAAEAGFESFEDTPKGVTGYVQQTLFDREALRQVIDGFPLPDQRIDFSVSDAEDRDWNEQWEQQGFEPIVVGDRCIVHDGRHTQSSINQSSIFNFQFSIEIDARLAFGTGTHETTRMMLQALLDMPLQGARVLDCGTGTGILAIGALNMGAQEAVAYDIDEWSADNARHNAVINRVDSRLTVLLGDATLLYKEVEGEFDVVVANINRNILLADMPAFRHRMKPGATLLLSGFYRSDIPLLTERAASLGLTPTAESHDGDWALLAFRAMTDDK